MNSKLSDFAKEALIARHRWERPIRVPLHAYAQFSQHIDSQLLKLVARWTEGPTVGPWGLHRRGIQ